MSFRTDTMIQETIRSKFKNCTVLISANRLQAVIDCDRVMVSCGVDPKPSCGLFLLCSSEFWCFP